MVNLQSNSIKKRLTGMSMLASMSALLLASAGYVLYGITVFRTTMVRRLTTQEEIVASNSITALMFADPHSAESTLAALKAEPSIISAGMYGKDGKLFASYRRDRNVHNSPTSELPDTPRNSYRFESRRLLLSHDIIFEGERVGAVYFEADLQEIYERLEQYALIAGIVLVASSMLAFLLSSKLQRSISGTVLHLAETARIISSQKDYSVRAGPSPSHDELSLLTETFNEMLSQIQQRDDALEQARREVEIRVQERTAELQASNKELEAFTYSVSHDLRAPLRHIDGFSKLLIEDCGAELSKEALEYISIIRSGTQQMSQLVDELLNLARVGRQELSLHLTGLDTLVDELVSSLKTENSGREIEWKIQPLPFTECDPTLMKQVFANLLSNAVKYTRPRSIAVIEVGSTHIESETVIFVRDNGIGFDMKHANKLFGVFQRLHRQEDFEGTGVGLAIIQRIINKHGGRVWADAALNKGATFFFTLGSPNGNEPDANSSPQSAKMGGLSY